MQFEITDNSDEVIAAMKQAVAVALERCGEQAEGYAQDLAPVDTGNLRNSITHTVNDDTAYIGTNSSYAAYVELGTGIFYPGGRKTPWAYEDAKGNWHMTNGQRAQPYLKPAVADHVKTYENIIKDTLKNG